MVLYQILNRKTYSHWLLVGPVTARVVQLIYFTVSFLPLIVISIQIALSPIPLHSGIWRCKTSSAV